MSDIQAKKSAHTATVIAVIAIGIAVAGISIQFNGDDENIIELKETITQLNATVNRVNATNTSLIQYLNERNEPFIQGVLKFANETDTRLDALEK